MKHFRHLDLEKEQKELIAHLTNLNKLLETYPNLHDTYKDQLEREIRFKQGILAHVNLTLSIEEEDNGKDGTTN
jgi:hypothetical protein